jgi:hypothetical protein
VSCDEVVVVVDTIGGGGSGCVERKRCELISERWGATLDQYIHTRWPVTMMACVRLRNGASLWAAIWALLERLSHDGVWRDGLERRVARRFAERKLHRVLYG